MNKSQIKDLVKLIYRETNGQEAKIEKIVQILKKDGSTKSIAILEGLAKITEKNEKQDNLYIESAFKLDEQIQNEITNSFEKQLGRKLEPVFKEDKNLIAGLRVKNGDFVWENSILSNLEQLKGVLTNE